MKKMIGLVVLVLIAVVGCRESAKSEELVIKNKNEKIAETKSLEVSKPTENKTEIVNVDWAHALEMNKNGAILIDVRTESEISEGFAPGAINIPLQEIAHRLSEIPKDKDLLIYCRSGRRSLAASQILIENGYDKVFNVVGGFLAFPR